MTLSKLALQMIQAK